jgi:copper chaperone CopZ
MSPIETGDTRTGRVVPAAGTVDVRGSGRANAAEHSPSPACQCYCECGCGGRAARRGELRRVTLPIFGLECGAAVAAERELEKTPGVVHAYVNPATEMAYVEFDACACGTDALKQAVRSAGLRAGAPLFR